MAPYPLLSPFLCSLFPSPNAHSQSRSFPDGRNAPHHSEGAGFPPGPVHTCGRLTPSTQLAPQGNRKPETDRWPDRGGGGRASTGPEVEQKGVGSEAGLSRAHW